MTEQNTTVEITDSNPSVLTQRDKDIMARINCINIALNIGVPNKSVHNLLSIASSIETYICEGVVEQQEDKEKIPIERIN